MCQADLQMMKCSVGLDKSTELFFECTAAHVGYFSLEKKI